MTDWKWTAWCQLTWRGERSQAALIMPLGASLSFDGKRWVSIDSLVNEPENGKRNRTPE